MPLWTSGKIDVFHAYAKNYISEYGQKIDCADLAIAVLADFAGAHSLPIRFKYHSHGWKWKVFNPDNQKTTEFKSESMNLFGALNVIDNTVSIPISKAKSGDLIMTKHSNSLGHTRVIYSVSPDPRAGKYFVIWYQGNLPPVVPERKQGDFDSIANVYGQNPRRWNFEQFNQ